MVCALPPSVSLEVKPVNMRHAAEMEGAIAVFARSPEGGLVVTSSAFAVHHRELIIALAARHKLPAVYYRRYFATSARLLTSPTSIGAPPAMSIASLRGSSRASCRCRRRQAAFSSRVISTGTADRERRSRPRPCGRRVGCSDSRA